MSDVIGRGVIEVSADATKLKAGIDEAKRSIKGLGVAQADVTKSGAASIDRYIKSLQLQAVTTGKTAREAELLKLVLRGASDAQLLAANTALRLQERHEKLHEIGQQLKTGFIAIGTAAAIGLIAAAAAFDHLVKKAGDFQDFGEIMGDTAANVASLAVAASVGGKSMEDISAFSVRLTKNLTGVDDESANAGAAISALGLDIEKFKSLRPAEQLEAMAKALNSFEDGQGKTAVLEALAKGGAQLLPFLKELGGETGRQNILTAEQIRLADEYSDKQKKTTAQISLYASAIATEMLPAYTDLNKVFLEVIKSIGGIEEGSKGLNNSTAIQDWADNAASTLAFVVDAGQGVATVFRLIGNSIAATVASQQAVLRFEFKQALNILADFSVEQDRILNAPTLGRKLEEQRAKRKLSGSAIGGRTVADADDAGSGLVGGRKLDFTGKDKDSASKAAQRAKAQLDFDVAQIKTASEATTDAYANAEKIVQARRAANLIDDKDYYAAKLGFLQLNSREQESALLQEIDRLSRERLVGKDKIDNDRRIVETQAKLAKVRADAAANITVNSIQEEAANRKIAQSYIDAAVAADAYIASIIRRNQLEVEGVGRGERFRSVQAGRNQIEDKFITERQKLERDRRNNLIDQPQFDAYLAKAQETYEKEIELYDRRTAAILAKEQDWVNGATEALQNYYDESRNIAKQTEALFTNAFKGMEDALVDFVKTGKLDFKSLADSIISDLIRIQVRQQITGPLSAGLGGLFGGGGGATDFTSGAGLESVIGGSFATGTDFVPRDMLALIHKGEAIIPAAENARGGGGIVVHQNIQFSANTPAAVRDAVYSMVPELSRAAVVAVRADRNRSGDQR